MVTINLKDFYAWYTYDDYVEVSEEVATELFADKRYNKTHERTVRRYKVLSLDASDGTEAAAISCNNDNPETIFEMMERCCRLCQALNSLPEIQGRRIEARYLHGKSIKEIVKAEGVSESAIKASIERGLREMRKIFSRNFQNCVAKCQ
jgi:RNA polymerase sigma-70 factor (ECF subfamily)